MLAPARTGNFGDLQVRDPAMSATGYLLRCPRLYAVQGNAGRGSHGRAFCGLEKSTYDTIYLCWIDVGFGVGLG